MLLFFYWINIMTLIDLQNLQISYFSIERWKPRTASKNLNIGKSCRFNIFQTLHNCSIDLYFEEVLEIKVRFLCNNRRSYLSICVSLFNFNFDPFVQLRLAMIVTDVLIDNR